MSAGALKFLRKNKNFIVHHGSMRLDGLVSTVACREYSAYNNKIYIHKSHRAEGPAFILAIGTANPPNCVEQSTYPDFYFRVTNSEHKTQLKEKFQRICKYSFNLLLFLDMFH